MAYIGNTPQYQSFAPAVDYFNGDGTTVTFTLSRPVASVAQLTAVIDNVIQNPSSAFTVAGNAITFTSAPLSGTNNIWVEYTSLVTTYAAISQDPSVIGDITATGGYLAEGDFGNSYIDGTIVDYVTGNARITTGPADGLTIYNGGTSARTALAAWNTTGKLTNTGDGVFNGVTVGKGAGSVSNNTVVGLALYNNTSGSVNSAFGTYASAANTTGSSNNAFGYAALGSTNTGSNNTAFGAYALTSNVTGGLNTAVGVQALNSSTTSQNTAIGYQAGYNTTSGNNNLFAGYQAGYYTTTGGANTYVGHSAGPTTSASTGAFNTVVGNSAAIALTTANNTVAIGFEALYSNTTPGGNIAIGYQAVRNGNGGNVTAVGYQAGIGSTCDNAAYFGYTAGNNATGGNGAVAIGPYTRFGSASPINEVVFGVNAGGTVVGKGNSSFLVQAGGGGYYNGANTSTWQTTSDRRIKKNIVDNNIGLGLINQIQVRNFEYRLPEEIDELPQEQAVQKEGVQLGVIAQELQEILPDCVTEMSTGVLTVDTSELTWYLINAVKELKAEIDALKAGK
jgi:hypothetical protein